MFLEWPELKHEVPTSNILDDRPPFDLTVIKYGMPDFILEKVDTLVEVGDNRAIWVTSEEYWLQASNSVTSEELR